MAGGKWQVIRRAGKHADAAYQAGLAFEGDEEKARHNYNLVLARIRSGYVLLMDPTGEIKAIDWAPGMKPYRTRRNRNVK